MPNTSTLEALRRNYEAAKAADRASPSKETKEAVTATWLYTAGMTRRRFTAPPQSERCTGNVILRDGSGAQCMHRAVKDGRCRQHPVGPKCPRSACEDTTRARNKTRNKTRYKSLDIMARDPRIVEIWDEGDDGLWAQLAPHYSSSCLHEWSCRDLLRVWRTQISSGPITAGSS